MSTLNFERTKRHLNAFDWSTLFVEELGWLAPRREDERPFHLDAAGATYALRQVAHLGGVVALQVESPEGRIPDAKTRQALHRAVESRYREHLLIFVDGLKGEDRRQTVWSYPKYDGKTLRVRSHHFVKEQPADLFLSKLASITFDLGDLDEAGNASLLDVTRRLREALDVERVTKKFYTAFKDQQEALAEKHLHGIDAERTKRHYASVFLTRLMFVYFLQKKGFLDPKYRGGSSDHQKRRYLQAKLDEHKDHIRGLLDPPSFYRRFLQPLFFQGFATRAAERTDEVNTLLGEVRYLNGGLFLEHPIEEEHPDLDIDDAAVEGILDVFGDFSWHLDDTPGGKADEINPDVLGYILEKYVNQKAFGAYYTPPEITAYLCDATIDRFLVEALSDDPDASALLGLPARRFGSLADLLTNLDDDLARRLLDVLGRLTVLDPAVGSGAFLVAALKKLLTVYRALLGHAELSKDPDLQKWLAEAQDHPSTGYFIKKEAITRNLYGVDLMPEAVEIAKLRLFLALVASADEPEHLEPLPNIDFNLLDGSSLVGLLDVGAERFIGDMFAAEDFRQRLAEKNRLVDLYRGTVQDLDRGDESGALLRIRDQILDARRQAQERLDEALRLEMKELGVDVKEARWTGKKATTTKRPVSVADVSALRPFHWAYEFSRIMERGGFDVIVTNPPWDILKPNDKEFFERHSDAVSKNKMRIEDFLAHKAAFLNRHDDVREEYEAYLTSFPHQSAYFRSADAYANQISVVDGRKRSSDLNLYKLFLERCFHLLHEDGHCGIVIPSGLYTDLGTKGLREMLFEEAKVTALFGFENRKGIFEDVDSRFKFIVLTFEKGGPTEAFPAAFMRHDVQELARFPSEGAVELEVETIKRLAPESWGLMEFVTDLDRQIAEKMAEHPALGEDVEGAWQVSFTRELDMTNDAKRGLFLEQPGPERLPLWEGKMVHQFTASYAEPRYWVNEVAGRQRLTKRGAEDTGQPYDYQAYRLGFRDVARNTDERTFISSILPPGRFAGNTLPTVQVYDQGGARLISAETQLFVLAVGNSFVFDWLIRKKVTNHCNFFYVYSQNVPRLGPSDPRFQPLMERAARLVCVTPEFDALAAEVGLGSHHAGATDPAERARLRAEIDGLVAHLYGLSEEEFSHILFDESVTGFSRVPRAVRVDAQNAYRDIARDRIESGRKVDDPEAVRLAAEGESDRVEFKSTLRRNLHTGQNDPKMEEAVLKTLAAFLNTEGGTLLVGVDDDGFALGLEADSFPNEDKLLLHLTNLVRDRMTPLALRRLDLRPVWLRGTRVLKVTVRPASEPIYVRDKSGSEAFYVRTGPSTTALSHSDTVAYVRQHFTD
ncbi:MAG: ATP-binding protein [Rhodothermaceae bacterium]|nr:ATP-binding protein [Rhodothermaceae bacterium]